MNISSVKVALARSKKITWQIIHTDNVINWVLGISLVLVPDFFNRLLFGHEVISHWIYILIGVGLILFAVWQVDNFIKERKLVVQSLRFFAFLTWLLVFSLTLVLLSGLGVRILLFSKILLWIMDVSMLAVGGWYWWVGEQIKA